MASDIGFSQILSGHYLRHTICLIFILAAQAGLLVPKDLEFQCNTVIFNFLVIHLPFQHHYWPFLCSHSVLQCFKSASTFTSPWCKLRILSNHWSCWGIKGICLQFQVNLGQTLHVWLKKGGGIFILSRLRSGCPQPRQFLSGHSTQAFS